MRELIGIFSGNEISVGILLATWLFWTAVGSAACGFCMKWTGGRGARRAAAALECLLAVSLPGAIWALRYARGFFHLLPGELAGPAPMLIASFACLSVFCAVSGALFVAAARMLEAEGGIPAGGAAGRAYLLEAAGSALGGIVASVALARLFGAFQIAVIVALLNLGVAAALLFRMKRAQAAILAFVLALAAIPLVFIAAPSWNAASRARLWTGFKVVASRDSVYGNWTVTEAGDNLLMPESDATIRSLYENGAIVANIPDPAAAEEAVHYALLEHAAPRRVLLIGGAAGGAIAEALKHSTVERLDDVELDPALIAITRQYFPAQAAALNDPRVRLRLADGRRCLTTTRETFDVIIVNVPDPQTAQLNRFYTAEFFRAARAHLAPGGLVAIQLRSQEETISPELADFLRSIRRTIAEVFPYQAAIPGETIHFFGAAEPGTLTSDPAVLIARLKERHIETQYVREYFIPYRMSADRMEQVERELSPVAATPVNRDFAPVAYGFDVLLWSSQFRSGWSAWFRAAAGVPFSRVAGVLAIALLIGIGLLAPLPGRERRNRASAAACVAATGLTLMVLQIFLLLGFQAVYGYVYTELAILIGLFMAGIALGSWMAMRRNGSLAAMQLLLAVAGPALLLIESFMGGSSSAVITWIAAQLIFPVMALLAGSLGGWQFVTAAGVFVAGRRSGLGLLYAIDLAGGCVGALVLSGFLIPVYGFWRTAWLVAGVNLAAMVVAVRVEHRLLWSPMSPNARDMGHP